jgi:hypothetical protein
VPGAVPGAYFPGELREGEKAAQDAVGGQGPVRAGDQDVGDRDQRRVRGQPEGPGERPLYGPGHVVVFFGVLVLRGDQGGVQGAEQRGREGPDIESGGCHFVQSLAHRVGGGAVVRDPRRLDRLPEPVHQHAGAWRRAGERQVRAGAAEAAGILQQVAGPETLRDPVLVEAGPLQAADGQEHEVAVINCQAVLLALGDHLADEPLDPVPVGGAAERFQPGGAGVRELKDVPELFRGGGPEEQCLYRVQASGPFSPAAVSSIVRPH